MSGPMADWADKAAIELLRSIGMQGGLYSLVPPVAVALRKARREGIEAAQAEVYDAAAAQTDQDIDTTILREFALDIAASIQCLIDQEPSP